MTLSGFVVDTYSLGIHGDVTISAWSWLLSNILSLSGEHI